MTNILPLHFQPDITLDTDDESDELVAVTKGVVYGMRYYTTDCGRWVIRYHTNEKNWGIIVAMSKQGAERLHIQKVLDESGLADEGFPTRRAAVAALQTVCDEYDD